MDVGKPLYGQMQKVKGSENDNVNVTAEPPPPVSVYDTHPIKNRNNTHSLVIIVKQCVFKALIKSISHFAHEILVPKTQKFRFFSVPVISLDYNVTNCLAIPK